MEGSRTTEPTAPIEPCRHMRTWVSSLADGSLTGLARWYTELHVKGCPHCKPALEAIRVLRERLEALARADAPAAAHSLPAERRTSLKQALDSIDGGPRST